MKNTETDTLAETRVAQPRKTQPRKTQTRKTQPRKTQPRKTQTREIVPRGLPRRRTFEPLPLSSLALWTATDFLTVGLGLLLILGMLVTVAMGLHWVVLCGAAAVMLAMSSIQRRWGRMSRARRLLWHRARRARLAAGGNNPGLSEVMVWLPEWHEPPLKAG